MERILVPGLYKYFKDKVYIVIGKADSVKEYISVMDINTAFLALDSETKENVSVYLMPDGQLFVNKEDGKQYVVYQAMYSYKDLYVREYDMFMSEVDHKKYPEVKQKYRFEKI